MVHTSRRGVGQEGAKAPGRLDTSLGVPRICSVFSFVIFLAAQLFSQTSDSLSDLPQSPQTASINPLRLGIMGGITAGAMVGSYLYVKDVWWSKNQTRFHLERTAERYALHIDKASHFWGGTVESDLLAGGLRWSGVEEEDSYLYGALMSGVISFSVEAVDGFAVEHGFSLKDWGAGLAGAWYRYLQYKAPLFRSVNFKASYWNHVPKYFQMKDQLIEQDHRRAFIDNYGNQTYWMVVNARAISPEAWKEAVPPWLGLAVGARAGDVVDVIQKDVQFREFQLYVALDIDAGQFLPAEGDFWRAVRRILGYIHLPSPAVRLTPRVVGFGLYW